MDDKLKRAEQFGFDLGFAWGVVVGSLGTAILLVLTLKPILSR
jgi:hypothetical protein